MNPIIKNLLDLRHSLHLTKGSIFFTLGIGEAISITALLNQTQIENTVPNPLPIIVALIWFTIFGALSVKQFSECNKIQKGILKSIKER
tara:strand:- start:1310 stop:1576 length:267 start_codon:yes stop_codon:yes gene_type:complete